MPSSFDFKRLFEYANDAIIIVNSKWQIDCVNQQTEFMFQYQADELLGKPIEVLIPDRFHHAHLEKRNEYANHPRPRDMGAGLSLAAKRKDGSEFPVDISLTPFDTENGTIVAATIRNLTDRQRVQAQERFIADSSKVLMQSSDYHKRV